MPQDRIDALFSKIENLALSNKQANDEISLSVRQMKMDFNGYVQDSNTWRSGVDETLKPIAEAFQKGSWTIQILKWSAAVGIFVFALYQAIKTGSVHDVLRMIIGQ